MVESTWEFRELPILEAIYQAEAAGDDPNPHAKAAVDGLTAEVYGETVASLEEDAYIHAVVQRSWNGPAFVRIDRLAPKGRRAVGQWPSGDIASLLLAELAYRIEAAPNDGEKTKWRRVRDSAKEVGQDVLTDVLTKVILRQTGVE